MTNGTINNWIMRPQNNQILLSFSTPKTPIQVENENKIGKFNIKPFLKRRLLKCLNPETYKGRLYALTNRARKLLKVSVPKGQKRKNYELIGRVLASPKQKGVILEALFLNSKKLTSEELRLKSKNQNPCLSRISTKNILKELIRMGLAESQMGTDRKRYYWISEEGKILANDLHQHLEEKLL